MGREIIVTGATGFIGSNLLAGLEDAGYRHIVAFDTFGQGDKWRNVAKRCETSFENPDELDDFLNYNISDIRAIIHLGAISSTTEKDVDKIMATNYELTRNLFRFSRDLDIPFIYASSASTYGAGENGFEDRDDMEYLKKLRPLNPYGWSKLKADLHVAKEGGFEADTPQVVGLKFFNVYGPNEYHKDGQKSVINTFYNQIVSSTGTMCLFESTDTKTADGDQRRDFVYVDDCVDVILWFLAHPEKSGLYNVGTGTASTFNSVAKAVAAAAERECRIDYIPMPDELRKHYQAFTRADIEKLRKAGYEKEFTPIEKGVRDYVEKYLTQEDKYR